MRVIREGLRATLHFMIRHAAKKYIAGPFLMDAFRASERLVSRGFSTILGYWDGAGEEATGVFGQYARALALLQGDCYLSIKYPALRYSRDSVFELAEAARRRGTRLHFDALGPESVEPTWRILEELAAAGYETGCTLPGRWRRSVTDARWLAPRSEAVRVVKGQWEDPGVEYRDRRKGFLEVISTLAGRSAHVAVATHDMMLARESIRRLRDAGTPCELELLFGLPSRRIIRMARELDVPVRIYVPYGEAFVPYCFEQAAKNPRLLVRLLYDCSVAAFQE